MQDKPETTEVVIQINPFKEQHSIEQHKFQDVVGYDALASGHLPLYASQ